MLMNNKSNLWIVLWLLLLAGCATQLETGGPYAKPDQAPDMAFFIADSSFKFAHSILDTSFKIERDNRDLLWQISPSIKHVMDTIREEAKRAEFYYASARQFYLKNQTAENLIWLQKASARMDDLAKSATQTLQQQAATN